MAICCMVVSPVGGRPLALAARSAVIDAEIVVCDDDGKPIRAIMAGQQHALCAWCFDLMGDRRPAEVNLTSAAPTRQRGNSDTADRWQVLSRLATWLAIANTFAFSADIVGMSEFVSSPFSKCPLKPQWRM